MSDKHFTPLNLAGFTACVLDDSAAGGSPAYPAVIMRITMGAQEYRSVLSLVECNVIIDKLMYAQNRARLLMEEYNDGRRDNPPE